MTETLFHPSGEPTDDNLPMLYGFNVGRIYRNGKAVGWCWQCNCPKCADIAFGPFRTEAAACKNADTAFRGQFPEVEITEGGVLSTH